MKLTYRLFLILLVIAALYCKPGALLSNDSEKTSISGIVYDVKDNQTLETIEIRVFRKTDKLFLKRCYSGKNGEYIITLENPTSDPIDIFYTDSIYLEAHVLGLKGDMEQKINKFLYREKYASVEATRDAMAAITAYYEYAVANNFPTKKLISKYIKLSLIQAANSAKKVFPQPVEELKVASNDKKIKAMQYYLEDQGFYDGPIDGVIGCKTVEAANAWSKKMRRPDHPIVPKGLNAITLDGLGNEAAMWVMSNPAREEILWKLEPIIKR